MESCVSNPLFEEVDWYSYYVKKQKFTVLHNYPVQFLLEALSLPYYVELKVGMEEV